MSPKALEKYEEARRQALGQALSTLFSAHDLVDQMRAYLNDQTLLLSRPVPDWLRGEWEEGAAAFLSACDEIGDIVAFQNENGH